MPSGIDSSLKIQPLRQTQSLRKLRQFAGLCFFLGIVERKRFLVIESPLTT